MKKRLLILAVVIMAIALCMSITGIAGASETVIEIDSEYYVGEYGDIFAGHPNEQVRKVYFGTEAVILFGQVSGLSEEVEYEYGIVIYPQGKDQTDSKAILFPAKKASEEGKFGIAISLSQSFIDSGEWSARTYVKEASAPLTPENCTYSDSVVTFSTEQYSEPQDVVVGRDGVITWEKDESSPNYTIEVKWENEIFWKNIATVTENSYDFSDYLMTLTKEELKMYNGNIPSLRITPNGGDKVTGNSYIVNNAFGCEYKYKTSEGEYVLDEEDNRIIIQTYDYRLAVVDSISDIAKYADSKNDFWYMVLANDIEVGTVTPESLNGKESITGVSMTRGVLNGNGHTISYKYVDTEKTGSGGFSGLFNLITTNGYGTRLMNLTLDAVGEVAKPNSSVDDWYFRALTYQYNAHSYNCYFKMRATTTEQASTSKSRAVLVQRLVGADTEYCNAQFENCVFDMVTYGSDGNPRALGASQCDALIAWQNANGKDEDGNQIVKNKLIKNCTYIINTPDTSKRAWTSFDGTGVTIDNCYLYAGAAEFATAWLNGEIDTEPYEKAGWSVDEYSVKFKGEVIYEIPYATPSNLEISEVGLITWDEVEDADSYKLRIKWSNGDSWIDLPSQTVREWDLTTYLKSLTETQLKAHEGEYLTFALSATGSDKPDSNEAILSNVFGVTSKKNHVLKVATNLTEFSTYTIDTANFNYTVLTRDISIANAASSTANQTLSITGGTMNGGVLNGLGHKISYVYDDTIAPPTANGTSFNGVWNAVGGANKAKIMNIVLDAEIVSARSTIDNWHASAFTTSLQAEVYNSFFKLRGYTPNLTTANNKSRIILSYNMISSSTGSVRGSYENCIFDMVTYNKDGSIRAGGSTYCDTLIARSTRGTNGNMYRDIKNCTFIMNQNQTRTWSEIDSYINITNSAFYTDFTSFIAAWTNNTLAGKANYVNAGYTVDTQLEAVKLNGITIYEKTYATPTNATTSAAGVFTWNKVDGATSYDVLAEFGDGDWKTMASNLTTTSYDLNVYLRSLSGDALKAIDGKIMNVAVVANGETYGTSPKAKVANALNIDTKTGGKIRVAYKLADLRSYCGGGDVRNYVILANDINIGTIGAADLLYGNAIGYDTGFIVSEHFYGTLNGLGRKISYNFVVEGQRYYYDSDGKATTTTAHFGGLFGMIATSSSRIIGLQLDASGSSELTLSGNNDTWWCMLSLRATSNNIYNSYFKMRYTCTNKSTTEKTRTAISFKNNMIYNNCIFDMVTMDKDGNYRAAGTAADCELCWEAVSGTTATVTNCAYITTTETTNRNIGGSTVTNTEMYKDFAAFITAWNTNSTSFGRQNYIDGGWSVENNVVYLQGKAVNA